VVHTAILIAFFVLTAAGGAALQHVHGAAPIWWNTGPMSLSCTSRCWQGNGASYITFGKEGSAGAESACSSSSVASGQAPGRSSWM